MNISQILQAPVITEKSAGFAEAGKYVFRVHDNANKIMIKMAFQKAYGVLPVDVQILAVPEKRTQRRGLKRRAYKKAIIILPEGKTVDLADPQLKS